LAKKTSGFILFNGARNGFLITLRITQNALMDAVKKYVAPAVAILVFALITAVFFKPLVFEKKPLKQGDIQHHLGMSKEIADFREKEGREPLWTNSMFGGMPAYQISVLYDGNWINPAQLGLSAITRIPFPITAILLCMVGFYFLMLTLKVDPWLAIGGAIAFGLTSYMITLVPAGHNSKMYAIAYMAPVVMGVLLTFRGRFWLGVALTAVALAFEINANHLQITYYLLMLLLFIGAGEVIRLIKKKEHKYLIKVCVGLLAAVVIGVLPNVSNLMLTNEYGKYTTRGTSELTIDNEEHNKTEGLSIDYATQWCYSVPETYTLMIPDVMGGASQAIKDYDKSALKKVDERYQESIGYQPAYFGDVIFTSGPYYVGAIIVFLALLAFFIVEDKIKWWLGGASLLAILLSWGHHFMPLTEFFFNYVPGYNKFRAVSMILVIVNLTFPILAMLAVRDIMKNPALLKQKINSLYIAFGLTGGVCLLFWLMPGALLTTVNTDTQNRIISGVTQQGGNMDQAYEYIAQLETAREAIASSDAARSFGLILLVAGLLWAYVRFTLPKPVLVAAVVLLVSADLIFVGKRYISKDDYEKSKKAEVPYKMSVADQMVLQDKDPSYRVLNLSVDVWQDASTSYFHKSIGGYHGAKLKRIQELYEQVLSKQISAVQGAMQTGFGTPGVNGDSVVQAALARQGAINMFNIKYVIYNPEGGVITNASAAGPAWFVDEVRLVPNADSEIVAVSKIDTRKVAVVDERFKDQLNGFTAKPDPNASVKLISHAPDKIEYETNSSSEGVVMFPEVYYPLGWNAMIDGKEAPYFCGNYIIRGMRVPAGTHKITFEFRPDGYYKGEKIAMFGSILVLLVLIGGIAMDVMKKGIEPNAADGNE
jgi:hypothetical protein